MNGADALMQTLADRGVAVCFANPGTSEMQLVAAFDREPRIRPILCLFEGVATGAADGYARMTRGPAATLLHLGAGLSNASANLHNARRAGSPIVNLVGEHATWHRELDAPLASDIAGLAAPVSVWVATAQDAREVAALAAEAVNRCRAGAGGPVSLVLPADCLWSEVADPARAVHASLPIGGRVPPDAARVAAVAAALRRASSPVLLLGSGALTEAGLQAAGRIARAGPRVFVDTFVARMPRGAGRFAPERLPYFAEMALTALAGADRMVLVNTKAPVSFFGYPGRPSVLVPEGCVVETLVGPEGDGEQALMLLADLIEAPAHTATAPFVARDPPTGALTPAAVGAVIARHLPQDAVVSEDAVTTGGPVYDATIAARPHDWLCLMGGAIGQGIPVAVGAAVACGDRKVLCVTGDGAAAYTLQGLWTAVRENLDITVVVCANRAYRILDMEFARTRSGAPGGRAQNLLALTAPTIDWCALAGGFGMFAETCGDAESFDAAFARAMRTRGPRLIEARI